MSVTIKIRKPHLVFKDDKGKERPLTHDEIQSFIDGLAIGSIIGILFAAFIFMVAA